MLTLKIPPAPPAFPYDAKLAELGLHLVMGADGVPVKAGPNGPNYGTLADLAVAEMVRFLRTPESRQALADLIDAVFKAGQQHAAASSPPPPPSSSGTTQQP